MAIRYHVISPIKRTLCAGPRFLFQFLLQPIGGEVKNLPAVCLIENFMSPLGEQMAGYVLHARLLEFLGSLPDPLSVIAHRVVLSGNEQHRQILVHFGKVLLLLNEANTGQHIPQQARRRCEAAAGVGNIGIHDFLVPGQPVIFRSGVLHPLIVAAKDHILQSLAGILLPHLFAGHLADADGPGQDRPGLPPRAADDHRSNAARGIDEIPTIHEGVTAQALERKGIISDRCEINRQIREQNKLIRAIRDEITKLKNTIMTSVPALAKALETARKGILLLRYSWLYHTGAAKTLDAWIQEIQPSYERFLEVRRFLCEKSRQKKALTAELKALSPTSFLRRGDIKRELAAVTEDMGELKSELSMLLADFGKTDAEGMKDVKQQLDAMTASKTGLETIAAKAADSMDTEIEKFRALQEQAKTVNTAELHTARMELRGEMTAAVREKIKDTFGKSYDYDRFRQADRDVSELLGEPHPDEQRSVLHKLHRTQEQPAAEKQNRSHKNEQEL